MYYNLHYIHTSLVCKPSALFVYIHICMWVGMEATLSALPGSVLKDLTRCFGVVIRLICMYVWCNITSIFVLEFHGAICMYVRMFVCYVCINVFMSL